MTNVEPNNREATRHSLSMESQVLEKFDVLHLFEDLEEFEDLVLFEDLEVSAYLEELEALALEMPGSSQQVAAAAVPAQLIPISAGEIVKLLPRLSPGLREALLGCRERYMDGDILVLHGGTLEKLFELTLKPSFRAELEAQVGGAVGSDVILQQLSLCLLLATAASLPDTRCIQIFSLDHEPMYMYLGEQAVEVLCYALVSQHLHLAPGKGVRRLLISNPGPFGTDRGCAHLAHLLESGHCRLQKLKMSYTATGASGIHHIARALRTNTSLTQLEIKW